MAITSLLWRAGVVGAEATVSDTTSPPANASVLTRQITLHHSCRDRARTIAAEMLTTTASRDDDSKREVCSFSPWDMESESPCETDAVVEMTTALRSLRSIHDEIAKVNDTCEANVIPDLLARYEEEVARVWDSLSVMHFHGREHLLREVLLGLERFQQPKFRAICSGWIGTPGVEERCARIENHWSRIQYVLLQPSKEVAVRQLVQYALPKSDQIAMAMGGTRPLRNSCVYVPQQRGGCFPPGEGFSGLVNLNVAHSGADASATLKSSQELQCELKLAQTMEIANSQEQRFKTLLKDLNSSAAELLNKIEQSQDAQQEMLDISANSKQTLTELKAQNEAAQQITNQIQRDRVC